MQNGYSELLSQLTVVGDVTPDQLLSRYMSMSLISPPSYYVTVIEETA